MSPRTGRPPADGKPKEYRITYRATIEDNQKLEFCCNKTGLTKSDIIRQGVNEIYDSLCKGEKE